MRCPVCDKERNYKTIYSKEHDSVRERTYKCLSCGGKFRSKEVIVDFKKENVGGRGGYTSASLAGFDETEVRAAIDSLRSEMRDLKKRVRGLEELCK